MPNYTNNYSLIKPKKGENYDVDETTGKNMDIIDAELHKRVEKQAGKGLSSNDFTDEYKNKLDNLNNTEDSGFTGNYNDLTNKPDLSQFVKETEISAITNEEIDEILNS